MSKSLTVIAPDIYADLIGKPHGELNCYGLAVELYRRLGREIPTHPVDLLAFAGWFSVSFDEITAGDLVLCHTIDGGSAIDHVAVYAGAHKILHSHNHHGVIVSSLGAYRRSGSAVRVVRLVDAPEIHTVAASTDVTVVTVPNAFEPTSRTIVVVPFAAGKTVKDYAPAWANLAIGPEGIIEDWSAPVEPCAALAFTRAIGDAATLTSVVIGVMLQVGGYILSALLAPGTAPVEAPTPSFDLTGLRNTSIVGGAQPIVYGERKVAGNIINAFQKINNTTGRASLWMMVFLSRGPIEAIGGLTTDRDGLTGSDIPDSIQIDGNPASSYDCEVYTRLGGDAQEAVPGFDDVVSAVAYDVTLLQSAPFVHVCSQAVDAVDVQISFPLGLYDLDNGVPTNWYAAFRTRYRLQGAPTWSAYTAFTFNAARRSPTIRQHTITLPALGVYEIEIERTANAWPESGTDRESKSVLTTVNEITRDALAYPGKALVALKIAATDQLSGAIPTITAVVKGRKVWVWDGVSETSPSFGTAAVYTDNPAWCLCDLLLSTEYGMGRGSRLTLNQIDLAAFDAWADYCDEIPETGSGKRALLSLSVDTVQSGWELVASAARSAFGRAMIVGNQITILPDKTQTVAGVFSMGNMRDFSMEWRGKSDRVNACEVQYLNADTGYEADWQRRYDNAAIFTNGNPVVKRSFQAVGVTRAIQAARLCQRDLNRANLVTRRIEWTAGVESLHLLPLDVVRVQHDAIGKGVGGRAISSTGTTVKLNATVATIPANATVSVRTYDSGTGADIVQTRTVTATDAAAESTLTVSVAWTVNPAAGDPVAFGSTTAYEWPKNFQIESATLTPDLTRRFVAVEYDADVYTDDPGEIESFTDTMPDPRAIPARAVRVAAFEEALVSCEDGCARARIRIEWDTVNTWERADVWFALAGHDVGDAQAWDYAGRFDQSATIEAALGVCYIVSVATVSAAGSRRMPRDGTYVYCQANGRQDVPGTPTAIVATVAGLVLTLVATPPASLDAVAGYEFRYGATWAGSILLAKSATTRADVVTPHTDTSMSVYVRTYSASGVYSLTAASVNVDALTPTSIYTLGETVTDTTTYTGAKTNTAVSAGDLVLDGSSLTGSYEMSAELVIAGNRSFCNIQSGVESVLRTLDECGVPMYLWTETLDTTYLDGYEVRTDLTLDQMGWPFSGLIGSILTLGDLWPNVVNQLAPVVTHDLDGAGEWPVYTPRDANYSTIGHRVAMSRPHSRYVPRLSVLVASGYTFAAGGGGSGLTHPQVMYRIAVGW